MDAAHAWGIRPSELGLCEQSEDVSMMVAYLMTTRKMQAWNSYQAQKEAKRQTARRHR